MVKAGRLEGAKRVEAGVDAAAELERLLTRNLLGFWDERIVDGDHGGYLLAHDEFGRLNGTPERYLVTQARTLWFFSRLARSRWALPVHLEWASHGYRFLRDHMWDATHGGFYWRVAPDGSRDDRKHLYGQAFALLGLLQYAHASDERDAGDLADELFELLEAHGHDEQAGGYHESHCRDWSPEAPRRLGLLGHPTGLKTFNTHLHLMSALTAKARYRPSGLARQRLSELVLVQSMAASTWSIARRRGRAASTGLGTSCGHEVENVSFLMDACAALGISDGPLLPVYSAVWDKALSRGFDHRRGGFYEGGRLRLAAPRRTKVWWVQAEGLLGALRMYRRTREERYLETFHATLRWIVREQADWAVGDWHREVSRRGRRRGDKAGPWQDAFHQGRALIECLEALESEHLSRSM